MSENVFCRAEHDFHLLNAQSISSTHTVIVFFCVMTINVAVHILTQLITKEESYLRSLSKGRLSFGG